MVENNISGLNYQGLRKRPTYENSIDYFTNDPDRIKYPDRRAKLLRNGFELSQLDGEGMRDLEDQQLMSMKFQAQQNILNQMARDHGVPISELQGVQQRQDTRQRVERMTSQTQTQTPQHFEISQDDDEEMDTSTHQDTELREEVQQRESAFAHDLTEQAERFQYQAEQEVRAREQAQHARLQEIAHQARQTLQTEEDQVRQRAEEVHAIHEQQQAHIALQAAQLRQEAMASERRVEQAEKVVEDKHLHTVKKAQELQRYSTNIMIAKPELPPDAQSPKAKATFTAPSSPFQLLSSSSAASSTQPMPKNEENH